MITIRELLRCKKNINLYNVYVFDDEDVCYYSYDVEEHRHPDDGSFATVWYHIPEDILNLTVDDWDIMKIDDHTWDTIVILSAR